MLGRVVRKTKGARVSLHFEGTDVTLSLHRLDAGGPPAAQVAEEERPIERGCVFELERRGSTSHGFAYLSFSPEE
jgi:hypothetical protein